ncbi:hypothetical protein TBLA_0C00550 [Henningerozyma blattae CBS 6284]|uniref:Uncharacterized protein n=1 Tax=Henningerozyma blattae (strain ATCC 34711 / CBS 6284 / DSM 70876 / NBRC 10599 / NRRL Y-10934 / UCD 77-7) TaxID=1071380 RepID=I2H0G9_HENB6|nr:hypothetical protein TBLA_0C00550 [Tetrapisispora blattae CBS 6284]CCH59871.1 hypothetical protein TBLA_0C00550 [Tetrapisispora blattae CBS 6284]
MENYGNSELQQEPSSGSRTVDQSSIPAVLQLRANGHAEQDRAEIRRNSHRSHIRWEQDVVDNEHMDKKKLKYVVFIIHLNLMKM